MTIKTRMTLSTKLPSGKVISSTVDRDLDANTQLAKNFKLSELANNKAADSVKAIWNDDVAEHCVMLQELRNRIGTMNINSWYRTKSFNAKCGGSSNSLHLKALATDVSFPKLNDAQYNMIEGAWKQICSAHGKVGGCNRYSNGIHVSSREDLLGYKSFVVRDYRHKKGDW